jgi:hypothetical protein
MMPVWFDVVRQFDWQGTLKVALTSSVISSIVAIGWNSYRDRRNTRLEGRDAALEVALSLEKYVRTCRAMMHKAKWASAEAIRMNRSDLPIGVHVPDFTYPTVEWKCLNHRTTSVLRDFPATVHYAREYVNSTCEYALAPDVCDDLAFECAKLAKRALVLARLTRMKHGAARWNPGAADADLEQELDEHIASRQNRHKIMREPANLRSTSLSGSPLQTDQTSPGGA